jgi:CheY-like chemotaxis protein
MEILILEDDPAQAKWLREEIQAVIADAEIELVTSEHEFRERIPGFAQSPPDVFLLDVMVRWTKPSPKMPEQPQDVKDNGYYRAGNRCVIKLRENNVTVPAILYTILENGDIGDDLKKLEEAGITDVTYVKKESNPDTLIRRIKSLCPG